MLRVGLPASEGCPRCSSHVLWQGEPAPCLSGPRASLQPVLLSGPAPQGGGTVLVHTGPVCPGVEGCPSPSDGSAPCGHCAHECGVCAAGPAPPESDPPRLRPFALLCGRPPPPHSQRAASLQECECMHSVLVCCPCSTDLFFGVTCVIPRWLRCSQL